ncbi:heavy metal translocating P-type ATPase [Rhizobium sp. 18055]|uniref:heavy metal translocating P-type ATPase n=1 Tax=Rhizobium sp. 18055 TaxID=2681403 RepID=UPI001FCEF962|nr:heavy metal translocating P-type ATPase [Rhizobium sp. 18055]
MGPTDAVTAQACSADEMAIASKSLANGLQQSVLSVPAMHCAACIGAIEKTLSKLGGVSLARANLSTRTVTVNWTMVEGQPPAMVEALAAIGFASHPPASEIETDEGVHTGLVSRLAVAGFCSMNIMLLSVSVWAGADPATRQAFHLISAILACPAVLYSGSVFYMSAAQALAHGRVNMDVPISLGIILSFMLSLYDALTDAPHAYFEASTSLVFVLLIGRVLDNTMRRKAKSAVAALARLSPRGANLVTEAGTIGYVALSDIKAGMRLLVPVGGRCPVDGTVAEGESETDASLVTGESRWKSVRPGSDVRAGELNITTAFIVRASVDASQSLIFEMSRMLQEAEDGRSRYRRLADRAAGLYAPVVHSVSALALVGWLIATGDLHKALTIAIAVLIITCPCALGLAVPMVQVVLARRLFERGVMATDGSAYERLNEIDTVIFDKTGTLTTGQPALLNGKAIPDEHLILAGSLAQVSDHPISLAIRTAFAKTGLRTGTFTNVVEKPGLGIEGSNDGHTYRLGRCDWAVADGEAKASTVLSRNGQSIASFQFGETIRPGAVELVQFLKRNGKNVAVFSGDSQSAVKAISQQVGITDYTAGLLPGEKVAGVQRLQDQGRRVLMIGDGINDAPALKAAHVSMAPSTASDIGRSAADFIFLADSLWPVTDTIDAASRAHTLIRQNFALAALYNLISLPFALSGLVTPLAAAIAMSTSSIIVVANALRLRAVPTKVLGEWQMTPVPREAVG